MKDKKESMRTGDTASIGRARAFLEDYHASLHMLRLCREDAKERERLSHECRLDEVFYGVIGGNEAFWLERMHRVRDFVASVPDYPCQRMLYYYYIRGLTVERTAEELDISRSSAFRLKRKALALAAKLLEKEGQAAG